MILNARPKIYDTPIVKLSQLSNARSSSKESPKSNYSPTRSRMLGSTLILRNYSCDKHCSCLKTKHKYNCTNAYEGVIRKRNTIADIHLGNQSNELITTKRCLTLKPILNTEKTKQRKISIFIEKCKKLNRNSVNESIRQRNPNDTMKINSQDCCEVIEEILFNKTFDKRDNSYEKAKKQRDMKRVLAHKLESKAYAASIKNRANDLSLSMCKMNRPLNKRLDIVKINRVTKNVEMLISKKNNNYS